MKMTKKLLCDLLTMIMLLSLFPMAAFAAKGGLLASPNIASDKVVENSGTYYCQTGTNLSEAVVVKDNGELVEFSNCTVTANNGVVTTIQSNQTTYTVKMTNDENKNDTLVITGVANVELTSIAVDASDLTSTAVYGASTSELISKITASYTVTDVAETVTKELTSGFTVSPETVDYVGAKDYKVSYGGKETTVSITGTASSVSSVELAISAPVAGVELGAATTGTTGVNAEKVSTVWKDSDGATVTGKAQAAKAYTAVVTIEPATGYAFSAGTSVTQLRDTTVCKYNEDGTLTVTYSFPATKLQVKEAKTATYNAVVNETVTGKLPQTVEVVLSDGSTADFAVEWTTDDLSTAANGSINVNGAFKDVDTSKYDVGTITPKLTVTVTQYPLISYTTPDAVTYDGASHTFAVAISTEGAKDATVTYTYDDKTDVATAPSYAAGSHEVSFKIEKENYETATGTFTATVSTRAITITVNSATKVFGAADPAFGYTISSGSLASGETLSLKLSRTGAGTNEGQKKGSYNITATDIVIKNSAGTETTANYSVTVNDGTLTITSNPGAYIIIGTDSTTGTTTLMNEDGEYTYRYYSGSSYYVRDAKDITDGNWVQYNGNTNETVTLVSQSSYTSAEEVSVYFNGTLLGGEYYYLTHGSTKVTIGSSYLKTLAEGYYAVDIVTADKVNTRGYVWVTGLAAQRNSTSYNSSGYYTPKTGDTSNLVLWISLLLISAVVIVVVAVTVVKKKKKNGEDQ